jgi:hypothetical protein
VALSRLTREGHGRLFHSVPSGPNSGNGCDRPALANANPIVGVYNSGYTACKKKDPIDGHGVSTADQVQAAAQLAATLLPVAGAAVERVAEEGLVSVTHFTDPATGQLIEQSGAIRAQSFVTLTSEIPAGSTASEVEAMLEIRPGAGQSSYTFQVPQSSLLTPGNGPVTSGGKIQFQLANPVSVGPGSFVPRPK